jgi:DNA-binding CsgD family transcriptional regulator
MGEGHSPLTPTEQAIIESIRRGAPDAEIAARLGISILDVKRKVDVLKERYGVDDRAALGRVDTTAEFSGPLASTVPSIGTGSTDAPADDSFRDHFTASDDVEAPVHSRRAVLGALLAGGAAVTGVGAYFLLEGDNDAPPARPDPFATSTPTPTNTPRPSPTPRPPPTPHPGTSAIQPDPDAWIRRTYPNGADIDMTHGLGIVNAVTGATEIFQVRTEDEYPPDGWSYRVSPHNELVAANLVGSADAIGAVYRRSTGESFSWDSRSLDLQALADDRLVFHWTNFGPGLSPARRPTGIFEVVDASMRKIAELDLLSDRLALNQHGWRAELSRDAEVLAVLWDSTLFLADVATGRTSEFRIPAIDDMKPLGLSLSSGRGARSFAVRGWWEGPDGEYDNFRELAIDVATDGSAAVVEARPTRARHWASLASPDGQFWLEQGSLRSSQPVMGEREEWVYAEVFDASDGASLVRVLSGQLTTGLGIHRRWLADSSGFVVHAQADDTRLDHFREWRVGRRHYIARLDGTLEPLPPPPLDGDVGRLVASLGGVEPAPYDTDLLAFGGVVVHERSTGRWLGPRSAPMVEDLDPWGDTSHELRFRFPIAGRGLGSIGTILPPLVERPPYRQQVDLVVARAGTCVLLRELPTTASEPSDCLPDGTRLTVVDPPQSVVDQFSPDGVVMAMLGDWSQGDEYQMFVHVRTTDGRSGWVAIQYLDWAP